jgi:hypothetical protein
MTKITFFPLGNADSTLLRFADGRMILKDYCNYESAGDEDRRVRLDEELRYYRRIARARGSESNYIVTMEYPSIDRPRPLIVDVTYRGFVVRRSLAAVAGPALVVSRPSPRLG